MSTIINSLLDTDFYKFTMGQVVFNHFPDAHVKYEFKCRNKDIKFDSNKMYAIEDAVRKFCDLRFTEDELSFLSCIPYFKPSYLEFLRLYQPNRKHIKILCDKEEQELSIIIEGPWFTTIYYEVPLLAIVNEVYFNNKNYADTYIKGQMIWVDKANFIKSCDVPFTFMDFGTRRRFSKHWHNQMINMIMGVPGVKERFYGTSNVMFAKEYGLKPMGTMAHEFLQAAQALTRISESQKFAFQTWANEYRGNLGVALSDVVGMDAFLRDFDLYFSKLFDGARHDSGDPIVWVDKLINHYTKLKIDPMTKLAVFSDGLTFPKIAEIAKHCAGKIKCSFGIGTNLTNDVGHKPLNIVIKMVECNGRPVAKISDSDGKQMCKDEEYLSYLKKVFNIENVR